jgi:uncharacterized protein
MEQMDFLNHDLAHEFPEMVEKMRALRTNDTHFKKMFDHYDELNRQVRKLEGEGVPIWDEAFESLKKARLKAKDDVYHYLTKP